MASAGICRCCLALHERSTFFVAAARPAKDERHRADKGESRSGMAWNSGEKEFPTRGGTRMRLRLAALLLLLLALTSPVSAFHPAVGNEGSRETAVTWIQGKA